MARQLRREGLDFVDRAPIRVREQVRIAAPPARVWPAIGDAERWTEWFPGMKVARHTTPEPAAVGTGRHVEVQSLKVDEDLLAFDPPERYAFRVLEANVPALAAMVELVTLEPVDSTTLVVYRQGVELAPWARPLAPVVRRQLASSVRAGLVALDAWATSRTGPA